MDVIFLPPTAIAVDLTPTSHTQSSRQTRPPLNPGRFRTPIEVNAGNQNPALLESTIYTTPPNETLTPGTYTLRIELTMPRPNSPKTFIIDTITLTPKTTNN